MTEKEREVYNQYQREYRKAHPEKVRRYQETYWTRRTKKMIAEVDQQTKTAGTEPEKVSK